MDARQREDVARNLTRALGDEPDVSFAYLHGSFVSQPAFRDVDVAVWLAADAAAAKDRQEDLSERLTRRIGVPIDVRPLNDAPLSFRFHALQGRLLLCRDDERLAQTIEETTRRYLDIEPILRIATREAFAP
jgi:hypothetical protein